MLYHLKAFVSASRKVALRKLVLRGVHTAVILSMLLTTLGVAPAQAAVAQVLAALRSLAPARAEEVVAPAAAAQSGPQISAWPDPEKPPEQKITPVTAAELQVAPMSAAEIKDLLSGEALPSSSVASEKGLLTLVALSPAIPGDTLEIAWMIEQEKGFEGAMLLVGQLA